MLKIVLDTNVVVSAAVSSDGNPAKIFEMLIAEKIKNYTSEEIINEIKDVMQREKIRKLLNLQERDFIINNFKEFSEKIIPKIKYEDVLEDKKDNKFLECAVSGKVDYIVSGDEHLIKLKEFKGIKIISPKDFMRLLKKGKQGS